MPGTNNNQAVRTFQPQFKELLEAVYKKQAYFRDFFGGSIQAIDGVANNAKAFSLKTSDIPSVITKGTVDKDANRAYKIDANIAFGDGTGNTTRFGPRKEITYADTDANYTWDWVFHEGIDRATVNNSFENAVADRLDLQAQAKIQLFDDQGGLFISKTAGTTEAITEITNDSVLALFNKLSATFINLQTIGEKKAWVTPALYNAIVDHPLTTSSKNSTANIDENNILHFKGFEIQETPDAKFQKGEIAYVAIKNIARQFTGINTARTIESEDFDGTALQGAGKAGEFILEDNKPAVIKVTLAAADPSGQSLKLDDVKESSKPEDVEPEVAEAPEAKKKSKSKK